MKTLKLLSIALCACFLFSCDDDPALDPVATLSVDPSTAIVFTATASESIAITVTTNQSSWNASSSQSWCQIVKTDKTFTVTATPNTSTSAPTPAVITISAGTAPAITINVTQLAVVETYPTTEAALKTTITKIWTFPETSTYTLLEFGEKDMYTLFSKTAFTRGTENLYLKTGTYTISEDLRNITLEDFGSIQIKNIDVAQIDMLITPTGETATTLTIMEQTIATPPASTNKRIKTVDMSDADEGTWSYTYNEAKKLTNINVVGNDDDGPYEINIPLVYEGNKVTSEFDGAITIGKPGTITLVHTLNSVGLSTSSTVKNSTAPNDIYTVYYTYNKNREMISWRMLNSAGKIERYCNSTWLAGNILSTYTWSTHTCNADFDTDGEFYHHDHNGDGIFDQRDVITYQDRTNKYRYTDEINKGGFMLPMCTPETFEGNVLDEIIQVTGFLGVSCKNLMPQHANTYDGDFTYTMNEEGYPVRMDVSYSGDLSGEESWFLTMEYE